MEVHIYIGTDSKAPKSCTRKYGYVLECNLRGTPWTKEKFGEAAGTYHSIVLRALIEAMKRLTKPSEVHIHTEDVYILSMLENNVDNWAENGYLTSKGEPVSNADQWRELHDIAQNHLLLSEPGKHTYTQWMIERMKKDV